MRKQMEKVNLRKKLHSNNNSYHMPKQENFSEVKFGNTCNQIII